MDALETEVGLRHRAATEVAKAHPRSAAAVRAGEVPPDADPVEVGMLAFLLRPAGWSSVLRQASDQLAQRIAQQDERRREATVERLQEQLSALRATSREELAGVRAEVDALRAENNRLRQRLETTRQQATAATQSVDVAEVRSLAAQAEAAVVAEAEVRRLRGRLVETEQALDAARRSARDGRTVETIRTRLLVDTLVEAAQGLRRELALPPLHTRPADLVTASDRELPGPSGSRGRDTDDPELLEELLAVPQTHLVVDGYNVTKQGYGELPLEDQRGRLVTALGSLAARTQAEITCVFDGADVGVPALAAASARRVRVRFSAAGVSADDVIRELVRAEPAGRPVVVVTNDGEVLRDVRLAGAWTAGSMALLRMFRSR
jgi:predicted RNA-binding protein with PIN domain